MIYYQPTQLQKKSRGKRFYVLANAKGKKENMSQSYAFGRVQGIIQKLTGGAIPVRYSREVESRSGCTQKNTKKPQKPPKKKKKKKKNTKPKKKKKKTPQPKKKKKKKPNTKNKTKNKKKTTTKTQKPQKNTKKNISVKETY